MAFVNLKGKKDTDRFAKSHFAYHLDKGLNILYVSKKVGVSCMC